MTSRLGERKARVCRDFDDYGQPIGKGCWRGDEKCWFVHPSDPQWPRDERGDFQYYGYKGDVDARRGGAGRAPPRRHGSRSRSRSRSRERDRVYEGKPVQHERSPDRAWRRQRERRDSVASSTNTEETTTTTTTAAAKTRAAAVTGPPTLDQLQKTRELQRILEARQHEIHKANMEQQDQALPPPPPPPVSIPPPVPPPVLPTPPSSGLSTAFAFSTATATPTRPLQIAIPAAPSTMQCPSTPAFVPQTPTYVPPPTPPQSFNPFQSSGSPAPAVQPPAPLPDLPAFDETQDPQVKAVWEARVAALAETAEVLTTRDAIQSDLTFINALSTTELPPSAAQKLAERKAAAAEKLKEQERVLDGLLAKLEKDEAWPMSAAQVEEDLRLEKQYEEMVGYVVGLRETAEELRKALGEIGVGTVLPPEAPSELVPPPPLPQATTAIAGNEDDAMQVDGDMEKDVEMMGEKAAEPAIANGGGNNGMVDSEELSNLYDVLASLRAEIEDLESSTINKEDEIRGDIKADLEARVFEYLEENDKKPIELPEEVQVHMKELDEKVKTSEANLQELVAIAEEFQGDIVGVQQQMARVEAEWDEAMKRQDELTKQLADIRTQQQADAARLEALSDSLKAHMSLLSLTSSTSPSAPSSSTSHPQTPPLSPTPRAHSPSHSLPASSHLAATSLSQMETQAQKDILIKTLEPPLTQAVREAVRPMVEDLRAYVMEAVGRGAEECFGVVWERVGGVQKILEGVEGRLGAGGVEGPGVRERGEGGKAA